MHCDALTQCKGVNDLVTYYAARDYNNHANTEAELPMLKNIFSKICYEAASLSKLFLVLLKASAGTLPQSCAVLCGRLCAISAAWRDVHMAALLLHWVLPHAKVLVTRLHTSCSNLSCAGHLDFAKASCVDMC